MKRWQFSTRSLLFLMAVVSLILAFAVSLPDVFKLCLIVAAVVLFVVGLFQSANFATSDRRPRMAVVAWLLLGTFFALFAFACIRVLLVYESPEPVTVFLALTMSGCCLLCGFRAYLSFRLVAGIGARTTKAKQPSDDS